MTTVALITLFASGLTFVLFGQVDAAWSAVGQGGAIASLCWAVYHLLSHTLPEQRDAFVETLTGMDERQHQDSVALNETLQQLRANCAAHNSQAPPPPRPDPVIPAGWSIVSEGEDSK